jgi:hypothetical protein
LLDHAVRVGDRHLVALVDPAVTVEIDEVTSPEALRRKRCALAAQAPIHAGPSSGGAGAQRALDDTGLAQGWVRFVDAPVAVLVLAVAGLERGEALTDTRRLTAFTAPAAASAGADVRGARRAVVAGLLTSKVHDAIAVVVQAVAGLLHDHGRTGHAGPALAARAPDAAGPRAGDVAGVAADEVFIRTAILVVVFAIAVIEDGSVEARSLRVDDGGVWNVEVGRRGEVGARSKVRDGAQVGQGRGVGSVRVGSASGVGGGRRRVAVGDRGVGPARDGRTTAVDAEVLAWITALRRALAGRRFGKSDTP